MATDWYSRAPQKRFSREHRERLPGGAHMIDTDGLIYAPYIKGRDNGAPIILIEFKPEQAVEDYWLVTRQLARMAGIPAARVIEQRDGRYTVHLATSENAYQPELVGRDLTVEDWFRLVELPLRIACGHRNLDIALAG